MSVPSHRVLVAAALLLGCHTHSRVTTTTPREARPVVDQAHARAMPAGVAVTAAGRLRFATPLVCAADLMVDVETADEITTRPNLATFVVGIVLTVAGGVGLVTGLADGKDAAAGAGAVGLAVGLPLAIGPWLGNGTTDVNGATTTMRKGATEVPCGDRPVTARTARVEVAGLRAFGEVDADGVFEVSPFTFVDVFAIGELPALDVKADLIGEGGTTQVSAVIDAGALSDARDAFLAEAGVDARVEPLRKVPRLDVGRIKVSRLTVEAAPRLRIVVPVSNDGPGDAWQVRAIVSSSHPEVDGRILYIGHVAPGAAIDAELLVPLSAAADGDLTGDEIELMVQLRDAHDTAPGAPFRFKGRVLADVPR